VGDATHNLVDHDPARKFDTYGNVPAPVISLFSELDEFQAALREDGLLNLLVTGSGQFRARLTQVTLDHLRLSAGDEYLSRIAFVAVPANMLLVTMPLGDRPAPIWDGVEMRLGEMITFGPGERLHARSDGPCQWGAIQLSVEDFVQYGGLLGEQRLLFPLSRGGGLRAQLYANCVIFIKQQSAPPRSGRGSSPTEKRRTGWNSR
jgi:hypothetical protein